MTTEYWPPATLTHWCPSWPWEYEYAGKHVKKDIGPDYARIWPNSQFLNLFERLLFKQIMQN